MVLGQFANIRKNCPRTIRATVPQLRVLLGEIDYPEKITALGSVASLLAAALYQGNPDRNHKLWNIVSIERYILHMQVELECCYI
jgi:hypothetical protein